MNEPARRYTALTKIASGGTAAVHVAIETTTGALVALKKPHAHLAFDKGFRDALMLEAHLASRIVHTNVVRVRDVEVTGDELTLAMDWIDGAALSDLIRSFMKEPAQRMAAVAIRIVLDACEGLHAAHELRDEKGALLGVVHRDVSPQNVLVGVNGVAYLTDFGLAKPLYAAERTTSEGALRGKLGYMAPEYVKSGAIDRRTDVFALGVVLWESLARKRLFRGDNDAQTIDRVREAAVPRLSEAIPGELSQTAASALDAVLARALAKSPDDRFPTARAFADALGDVAKAHDELATQAEVAASFGPTLKAELDKRRAEVAAQMPAPAVVVPSEVPRRSRRTLAIVAAGAAVVLAAPVILLVSRPARETQPQTSTTTATATTTTIASPTTTATATTTATTSSTTTATVTTTTTSTEASSASSKGLPASVPGGPGQKHPRPNPYGK